MDIDIRIFTVCLMNLYRFTSFDGTSAQFTTPGALTLYEESSGPTVVVEQAPCEKLQACVYRAILTQGSDIVTFDYTQPTQGMSVVQNGVEIYVHSEISLASGLLISRQSSSQYTVRSSNTNFKMEVRGQCGFVWDSICL